MPKIVDVEHRRQEIIDAVFRLVVRGGVEQASLRKVAAEADLNIGAVRNYFASHEELMVAAAREIVNRIAGRLYAHADRLEHGEKPADVARLMLHELLPLDSLRRDEATVLFAFQAQARTTPHYRQMSAEMTAGTRSLIRRILTEAKVRSVEPETDRLVYLLDGIAFNAVNDPKGLSRQAMIDMIEYHLLQLRRNRGH